MKKLLLSITTLFLTQITFAQQVDGVDEHLRESVIIETDIFKVEYNEDIRTTYVG
jgi:hypothetical protein